MDAQPAKLVEAAIEHCRRVTYRSRNNLAAAARKLPHPTQQRLFVAAYASMRVVDDYVDDTFLSLPDAEREQRRVDALALLERYREQVRWAAAGEPWERTGAFEPVVFEALSHLLSRADLSVEPWLRLADAMERDTREQPIQTWDDYLAYCEGACIAPASVFLYVLGCEIEAGDRTRNGLERPLEWYARDLAVFSYLVHMLRDLALDASRHPQLLALPRQEMARAGLSVRDVRNLVRDRQWGPLRPVLHSLRDRAETARSRARERIAQARDHLRASEQFVLEDVAGMYERAYAEASRTVFGTG